MADTAVAVDKSDKKAGATDEVKETKEEEEDWEEIKQEEPAAGTPPKQVTPSSGKMKEGEAPATKEEGATEVEKPSEDTKPSSLKDEITVNVINEASFTPDKLDLKSDDDTPNPVEKAITGVVKNVQGAVDPHVKKMQGAIDEHVAPHMKKMKGAIDEHVAPHVENIKQKSSKTFAALGESTKGGVEYMKKGTAENMEYMKKGTAENMEYLKKGTAENMEYLKKGTVENFEYVKKGTVENMESVKKHTSRALDEVAPTIETTVSTFSKYSPYFAGTAPALMTSDEQRWELQFLEGTFRAFGQVVFCNNPVTGAFILLAMKIASPIAGFCALCCVAVANLIAIYLGMDRSLMRKGILAYNAVLVGSGVGTFLSFEHVRWLTCFLVSIVAAPVVLLAYGYTVRLVAPTPPLLFPFNGVMLFLLLSAKLWDSTIVDAGLDEGDQEERFRFFSALFNGLSRAFLVQGAVSGFLIAIGMTACSRILVGAALAGSLLGALGGLAFLPIALINSGMAGFNTALTVPALFFFVVPYKGQFVLGIFGTLLTLGAQTALAEVFSAWSLPIMTLPFCLATLPILGLDVSALFGSDSSFMTLIPPDDLTIPEEHIEKYYPRNAEEEEGVEGEIDEGDIEEPPMEKGDAVVATEETPLLSS